MLLNSIIINKTPLILLLIDNIDIIINIKALILLLLLDLTSVNISLLMPNINNLFYNLSLLIILILVTLIIKLIIIILLILTFKFFI